MAEALGEEPVPAVGIGGAPAESSPVPLSQMLMQLREASAPTDWRAANRTLEQLGFAPLPLRRATEEAAALEQTDAMVPTAAATCATLLQMCEQYEARGTTLERALVDADALRRPRPDEGAAGLKAAEYERVLSTLQAQLDRARADGAQQAQQAAERLKTAELSARQLKQKVAMQAQLLRAREVEAQRLQERLAKLPEREAARKERERKVFESAHRRAPRPSSASDSRSLEIIGMYEARQGGLVAEAEGLREECRRLAEELRARDNLIARKDAFHSWRGPADLVTATTTTTTATATAAAATAAGASAAA